MIAYFAEHPTAANIFMVVLLILGIIALPTIQRETFPEVKTYEVEVAVVFKGANASEVEESICLRLEDATDGISYTKERRCDARDGRGVMTLKMFEGEDFERFLADVKSRIDAIDDFPAQAEQPVVQELGRTEAVVSVAITADITMPELKRYAEDLKRRMLRSNNIPLIEVQGFSQAQLRISLSDQRLRQHGLSVADVSLLVARQGLDLPLGNLETKTKDYLVRFSDRRRSPEQLEQLIVLQNQNGTELRLGDIATVERTFEREEEKIIFNGKPAALLNISKNLSDDALNVLAAVQTFITQEQKQLPKGLQLQLTSDAASMVDDRLSMLVKNAGQGLVLVFFTLLLFFSWRYSFWVIAGLPVSFFGGFFLMALFGVSLNMLSMVGLLLAIGILMDDAIVLSESIATHHANGDSPLQAAIAGTQEVAKGVASSFVTTMMILGGLAFLQGDMGQILKMVPIVLIMVLSVSLIEAFLILPHHLSHSLSKQANGANNPLRETIEQKFNQAQQKVWLLAQAAIRWRYAFAGLLVATFFLSVSLPASGILKFVGMSDLEGDVLEARIILPQGTPLQRSEEIVAQLWLALAEVNAELSENENTDLVVNTSVRYGSNPDAFENGAHLATLSVDLLEVELRHSSIEDIAAAWREAVGELPDVVALQFKEPALGPMGRPLDIRLYGQDLNQLKQAAGELAHWLKNYQGVVDVIDDLRPGKPELVLSLKPGALSLGLDATAIAGQLRAAFNGNVAAQIQVGTQDYDIQVQLAQNAKNSLSAFENLPIVHPQTGALIPLSSLVNISSERNFARIHRVNGQRAVSILGDVIADQANVGQVIADTEANFLPELMQRYPELHYSIEGELASLAVSQKSLGQSVILGFVGVYLLLSLLLRNFVEPIVVVLVIPLSLIGVYWGHFILGYDVTMPSMVGFISLAGIVVNDSIILVIYIRKGLARGQALAVAAAQASRDRFRAVLLTSTTTIAGVLPVLLETSVQAQIIIPLVISVAFGVLVATLLVLFVVPAAFAILDDFGWVHNDQPSSLPERLTTA